MVVRYSLPKIRENGGCQKDEQRASTPMETSSDIRIGSREMVVKWYLR